MRNIAAAFVMAVLGTSVISDPARADEIKVSELRIAPEKIGNGWTAAPGIVVDNLEAAPADEKTAEIVAGLKKQMRPLGVRGVADFTYRNTSDRNRQTTARIFVFDTKEQCQQWIKTKYQFSGWEEKYKRAEDKERAVFDSVEARKRIIGAGNVLITVGTIADQDDHLPVAELILAKLKEQTKPAEETAK
jgi:hypothetical protein